MSGIYLFFSPDGINQEDREKFSQKIKSRVTSIPGDSLDRIEGKNFIGASVHHGVLRSGGAAKLDNTFLLSCGSCWINSHDTCLASPGEILAAFNTRTGHDETPFGGTFALAHIQENTCELTVETDRFNAMPLYFREYPHGVAVSSEIKFLTEPGNDSINMEAFAELIVMGYFPRPNTLVKNIRKIPANSRFVFNDKGFDVFRYPTPGYPRNRAVDDGVYEEYDALIRKFFQRYKDHVSTFSMSLSGGLDSRLLAAAANREKLRVNAFTVGEKWSLDSKIARKVADGFGIPITSHTIDGRLFPEWFAKAVWFTEGTVLPGHMHYMAANFSRETPPGPQIHGLLGEAVMGGHFDVPGLQGASGDKISQECVDMTRGLNYWPPGSWKVSFNQELLALMEGVRPLVVDDLKNRMDFKGSYSDYLDYRFRLKAETFAIPCILNQVNPWNDIMCPFMDNEAFDFGSSLKLEGIFERKGQIQWGLKYLPEIGDYPRIKAGVVIQVRDDDPQAYARGLRRIMLEKKIQYYLCRISQGRINIPIRRSFPFYGQWYRRFPQVRNYVNETLLSEQTLDRGLIQREGVKRLLHDCRVGRDTWGAVSTLLMAEIFFRQFVDGSDIPENPTLPLELGP